MPTTSASKTRSTTNRSIPMPEDWLARLRQPPPHPGVVFREQFREPQDPPISQAEAARRMGFTPYHWGQVELGRRPFTAEMCVKAEALTGFAAESWARLQMHFDLWHAMQAAKRSKQVIFGEPFPTKKTEVKVG